MSSPKAAEINHLTESIVPAYVKGLRACETIEELLTFLHDWRYFVKDAYDTAASPGFDFENYKKTTARASQDEFPDLIGRKGYDVILMPEILFVTTVIQEKYNVPWGMAFIRLKAVGKFVERDGALVCVKGKNGRD